jgi:hypothetical protein
MTGTLHEWQGLTRMTGTVREWQGLYMMTCLHFFPSEFLQREMFQAKIVQNIKTHISCSVAVVSKTRAV